MSKDYRQLREQYENDPVFYKVVNLLIRLIEECQLTPFEIRNAAMFAAIKFQMEQPQPVFKTDNRASP